MKRTLHGAALALVLAAGGIGAAAVAQSAAVKPPPAVAAKLSGLSTAQRTFLYSDAIKPFAGNHTKLYEKFEAKSPAEIAAYIDAMMSVQEQNLYKEGRDMAAIPLDTTSKSFNAWKVKRPQELNPKREAGPIQLDRYMRGRGGIATFANAPVALTPQDLKAGKVDVAFVGAPLDMGSGYRGAAGGPLALRSMSGISGNDMYSMVNPSQELNIVDYGDIAVDNMSTERSMEHVREMVREIAATGAIPFIIGGDHSLMYSDAAGLADVYGKGNVGVVHFDAHYDAGRGGPHMISHGQPVYRLIKEGHVPGKNFIQVGLRAKGPDAETFQWMREQGFRYHTMVEVEKHGWDAVMKRAVSEAKDGPKKIFISFDVDALDPVYMQGTGTPVPGGLTIREAMPIVRRLCAETDVVGFELVEVAPVLDQSYKTALNSNYILNACLAGIAMRRKGMVEEHYLSPLSSEHGQR